MIPTSHGPIELTGVLFRNCETTLILVAPYAPEYGTVIGIDAVDATPNGMMPTSSPGSSKSPSIFQSI